MKRIFLILALLIPQFAAAQGALLPDFMEQYFDASGNPVASGFVCATISGTSTNLATYPTAADANAGTNANSNPVALDTAGRAAIWLGTSTYRIILFNPVGIGSGTCNGTPTGSAIKTVDGVRSGDYFAGINGTASTIAMFTSQHVVGNSVISQVVTTGTTVWLTQLTGTPTFSSGAGFYPVTASAVNRSAALGSSHYDNIYAGSGAGLERIIHTDYRAAGSVAVPARITGSTLFISEYVGAAHDGSFYDSIASIRFLANSATGWLTGTSPPGVIAFTTATSGGSLTEAMRIQPTQNLDIGTTTDSGHRLYVAAADANVLRLESSGASAEQLFYVSGNTRVGFIHADNTGEIDLCASTSCTSLGGIRVIAGTRTDIIGNATTVSIGTGSVDVSISSTASEKLHLVNTAASGTTSIGFYNNSGHTQRGQIAANSTEFDFCSAGACQYGLSIFSGYTKVFGNTAAVYVNSGSVDVQVSGINTETFRVLSSIATTASQTFWVPSGKVGTVAGNATEFDFCFQVCGGGYIATNSTAVSMGAASGLFAFVGVQNMTTYASPAVGTYYIGIDSNDGNKLKSKGSGGTLTTIGSP